MTARYTVVQYLPDPITGERINVGVVTWDAGQICSRFLPDWRRVQSFSGGSVALLRTFASKFQMLSSPQLRLALGDGQGFDPNQLEKMVGTWEHSIQFTPPRGSLSDAKSLLAEMVPIFLRTSASGAQPTSHRSRRTAAMIATRIISEAVERQVSDSAELMKKNETLKGRFDQHRFDVVLANGKPLAAVYALSFETNEHERLERAVDATAWLVEDVKKEHRNLPVAIFALPPTNGSPPYHRAKRLFPQLKGELVTEGQMPRWASRQARAVAEHRG